MAEGLLACAAMIGSGLFQRGAVSASSHNATSERQYRFPTELGVQRPMTAQWTVTGAGAMVLDVESKRELSLHQRWCHRSCGGPWSQGSQRYGSSHGPRRLRHYTALFYL